MNTVPSFLFLQIAQREHDLFAHKEIINSEQKVSLNHYTLHFFKYASNLDDIAMSNDSEDLKFEKALKQIRDTFLILLALSNNNNKDLDSEFNTSKDVDFREILQKNFTTNINKDNYVHHAFKIILKNGAKFAKLVESLDHMEPLDIKNILDYNLSKMIKEILPVMAFLQEVKGIDFEENIHLTHAAIKVKKPWTMIEYMNSDKGILVKDKLFPNLNLESPFNEVSKVMKQWLIEQRKNSQYSAIDKNLLFKETVIDIKPTIKENNDLLNFQIMQYKKENLLIVKNNGYINVDINKHLENCSFRIINRLLPLTILMQSPNENKEDLILNCTEAFDYLLSIGTKLNKRLDKYAHGKENFKDILQAIKSKNSMIDSLNTTCNDLVRWQIDSNENKLISSSVVFIEIYDKLVPQLLGVMKELEDKFDIDFKEILESSLNSNDELLNKRVNSLK